VSLFFLGVGFGVFFFNEACAVDGLNVRE